MAAILCSIASGSNGNCYYVGTTTEAVLVDAGISCREVEKRMAAQGLHMSSVKAIFLSHEHTDHLRGVQVLATKWKLPVYGSRGTLRRSYLQLPPEQIQFIDGDSNTIMGCLQVHAFGKRHDAEEPLSFTITCKGVHIGVFTDIGRCCDAVTQAFGKCHAAVLESNYDEQMLDNGGYPLHLKNRIRGGFGHLSNNEALKLFLQHRSPLLSHLFLGHISKNNNHPELVERLFQPHAGNTRIVIAGRFAPTKAYSIPADNAVSTTHRQRLLPQQLRLFAG